jgi:hypothetical protein
MTGGTAETATTISQPARTVASVATPAAVSA